MAKYDCFKCGGSGRVPFAHIENGVCFTCGGSGKLAYRPAQKQPVESHPEWVVPEGQRATVKQWNYLAGLCDESMPQRRLHVLVREAGAPAATLTYISKAVMSKAIDLAKVRAKQHPSHPSQRPYQLAAFRGE